MRENCTRRVSRFRPIWPSSPVPIDRKNNFSKLSFADESPRIFWVSRKLRQLPDSRPRTNCTNPIARNSFVSSSILPPFPRTIDASDAASNSHFRIRQQRPLPRTTTKPGQRRRLDDADDDDVAVAAATTRPSSFPLPMVVDETPLVPPRCLARGPRPKDKRRP